jgi:hypothetical protein
MTSGVKKGDVKSLINQFERALKRAADDDGRVDMKTLKAEVMELGGDKQLKDADHDGTITRDVSGGPSGAPVRC